MHNTAFVGTAHIHTPGFVKRLQARDDVNVKYVWDHDVARAQKNAQALNSQAVSDLSTIWGDSEVESVIICSETNRHEDLILAAVDAGKHMFAEKPLGMGAKDSYRMANAIDAAGLTFQTGYFNRGFPAHRFLRDQVQKGHFGKITRVRHSNAHSGSLGGWFDTDWLWMTDVSQSGAGAFGDLGTHVLDILLWIFGDVERVAASIDVATGRYGDCDEFGEGLIRFRNGIIGTLAAGWVDVADPIKLVISGTEGYACVRNNELYFKSEHVEGADGETPWTDLPEAWPHAFELFFDAMNGQGKDRLVPVQEAAYCCAVMEAFYKADQQQAWVAPETS